MERSDLELIDTCWNVNIPAGISVPHASRRINRYMLECKCIYDSQSRVLLCELIDTCWNVNSLILKQVIHLDCELIDTCWNVNQE